MCCAVMLCFYYSTTVLLDCIKDEDERYKLTVWLGLTFYSSAVRVVITFFISHFYAHKMPELFHAFEDYHQGIGAYIIKRRTGSTFQKVIIWLSELKRINFSLFLVGCSYCGIIINSDNAGIHVVLLLRPIHGPRGGIVGVACGSFLHVHVHVEGAAHKHVHVSAAASHVPLWRNQGSIETG